MDKNKLALASIAMDLKRVALGYHNGSLNTAKRFFEEALKRRDEIDQSLAEPYVKKLLVQLENIVTSNDSGKIAEDALMYSTLFQNAALSSLG